MKNEEFKNMVEHELRKASIETEISDILIEAIHSICDKYHEIKILENKRPRRSKFKQLKLEI